MRKDGLPKTRKIIVFEHGGLFANGTKRHPIACVRHYMDRNEIVAMDRESFPNGIEVP
jgi:hypothetical protein